jgi:hypothetical protein
MSVKSISILRQLRDWYGGSVRRTRKATEEWAESFAWGIFGKKAAEFLKLIYPYLRLKQEQARLGIEMHSGAMDKGAAIRHLVMELNRKGPEPQEQNGWFARLVGGIWLTPQRDFCGPLGWAEYSETWPRAGMTRNGKAYELPMLEHRTDESESGLWPTPDANTSTYSNHYNGFLNLREAVKMWPTPSSRDWKSESCTQEFMEERESHGRGKPLSWRVRYATPTKSDYRSPNLNPAKNGQVEPASGHALTDQIGGQLNPTWVEWLMGYPLGWTDLKG